MKAYYLSSGAGVQGLRIGEMPHRTLENHEVRVAIRAAALNSRDLQFARGVYPDPPDNPIVPLVDGVGEIVEVGGLAKRFVVGDRVITTYWPDWIDGAGALDKTTVSFGAQIDGTLGEEMVAHEDAFVRAPKTLSDTAAASISCAGVTAWNALFVQGASKPGSTVLIQGTGSVSVWALQLASAAGLYPIVTSSSDEKLARAKALGARDVVNYEKTPDWQDEVMRVTDGRGADLVLEVGGESTLPRSLAAASFGGSVIVIGGLSGFGAAAVFPGVLIGGMKRLLGAKVGSRSSAEDLVRFVDATGIQPVIDREYGFEDARAAYEHLQAGRAMGKVIVKIG